MAIPSELTALLGPVASAIVAGAVAFLATVLSKEGKISEFRQAWIDEIRQDIADLAAVVMTTDDAMAHMIREGNELQVPQFIFEHHQDFTNIAACAVRIELRLNPKEHKKLIELVRLVGTSSTARRGDIGETLNQCNALVAESQTVLKHEWRRVKRGELVFFVTKWLSLLVAVAAVVLATLLWQGHVWLQYVP